MKMLVAGGGTGGHLYPGIALAEELTTRQEGNEVLFVGTKRGIESRVLPSLPYGLETIEVVGLKGKGLFGMLRGLLQVPKAIAQSFRILREFKPDIAVGVGGYASGPMILACWLSGIPSVILEQNTIPGITNRILSRFVNAVFTTFESSAAFFPRKKVQALGNPIRRQLLDNFLRSKIPDDRFDILVLGGSQGAHALNLRMVEAAGNLLDLEDSIRIVHQTGPADLELVKRGYADIGLEVDVRAFIDDMSAAYLRADLVICRAGATTIAELLVAKKAAILIPYPYAADNHQELNAKAMVDVNAAVMFQERGMDGRLLADKIRELKNNPERVQEMERAASIAGRPEAAREIINALLEIIERRGRR